MTDYSKLPKKFNEYLCRRYGHKFILAADFKTCARCGHKAELDTMDMVLLYQERQYIKNLERAIDFYNKVNNNPNNGSPCKIEFDKWVWKENKTN